MLATPIQTDEPPRQVGPALSQGDHADDMSPELGYDATRIAALREQGVVA